MTKAKKDKNNTATKLVDTLNSIDKESGLSAFMHDWPDLDTMGGALLIKKIADEKTGLDTKIYYCGKPDFIMNRSAMQVLNLSPTMTNLFKLDDPKEELTKIKNVALIDVPSDSNLYYANELKDKVMIDIDHHKNGKELQNYKNKKFIHYTPVGACTSLLVNWTKDLGIILDPEKDKSLILTSWLGIKKDTHDFNEEELTNEDKKAITYLKTLIKKEDQEVLSTIEKPTTPPSWYKTLGGVMGEFKKETQDIFHYSLGLTDDSAIIPFLADEIFRTKYAKTVIVYGLVKEAEGDKIYNLGIKASGRSLDTVLDLNSSFSSIFSKKGKDETETGGGKKNFGRAISVAGALLHLEEYRDLDEDNLKKIYEVWDDKIKNSIKKEFPSSEL